MKDIHIYIHIALLPGWNDIFYNQLKKIIDSGLYEKCKSIFIGCIGDINKLNIDFYLAPFIKDFEKIFVCTYDKDYSHFESITLDKLHKHAKKEDAYFLYLHSKGVSYLHNPKWLNVRLWREFLEYFTIENWKECITHLEEYDAVGATWLKKCKMYNGHFTGNFWWGKSEYLKKLPLVKDTKSDGNQFFKDGGLKYKGEFWLGSKKDVKYKELHSIVGDNIERFFYDNLYYEKNYR